MDLKNGYAQKWVDIGSKRKDGKLVRKVCRNNVQDEKRRTERMVQTKRRMSESQTKRWFLRKVWPFEMWDQNQLTLKLFPNVILVEM